MTAGQLKRAACLRGFAALVALAASAMCFGAASEWRPSRTIEVIIGTPAGGPLDTTGRLIQKYLETRHPGQAVIALNKPGGGHVIA